MKKLISKICLLLLLINLFPPQVFAVATTLNFNVVLKNSTQGGNYQSSPLSGVSPGELVAIWYTATNSGSVEATNSTFSTSPLLNGEANNVGGNTAQALYDYDVGWIADTSFSVQTNSHAAVTYQAGSIATSAAKDFIVPIQLPSNYNKPSFTLTMSGGCSNSCTSTGNQSATVNVNVQPTVSSPQVTGTLVNNSSSAISITATGTDPSGISDIASMTINLSQLGGSSAAVMYDDGAHSDTASSDGIYGITGITTAVSAGNYSLPITITDSGGNTGTTNVNVTVQSAGSPIISQNSLSLTKLSNNSSYNQTTLNWQSSLACGSQASQGYKIIKGGTAGNSSSGTTLLDWQVGGCSAATARNDTILASSLDEGSNTIYLYVKTSDNLEGYTSFNLTKDTVAPTVTISGWTASVNDPNNAQLTWSANESGNISVRNGGSSGDAASGTQTAGTNVTGSYTSGNMVSTVNNASLAVGSNTIYVHLTDDVGNTGSASKAISRDDTPPVGPVSNISLADNDTTPDSEVDGRDFTITFTEPSPNTQVSAYDLYIYQASDSYLSSDTKITSIAKGSNSFVGTTANTTDSKAKPLKGGDYRVVIVSRGNGNYEDSSAIYSANSTIEAENAVPPAFSSAAFIDNTTLKITFDKNLSTVLSDHDPSKLSSSCFTINTAQGINGVNSISGSQIFLNVNALNDTAKTCSDLVFNFSYNQDNADANNFNKPTTAGFVKSVTGVYGPVKNNSGGDVRGTFNIANPIVSGNEQSVSNNAGTFSAVDAQAPNPISITSPSANNYQNTASLNFTYSLPETVQSTSLKLKFEQTGGVNDPNAPHTITLSNANAGSHTQTINLTNFTSQERGAGDSLNSETAYLLTLSAVDLAGNAATNATVSNFVYDVTSPSAPSTLHFPVSGGSNNQWTNDNTPLLKYSASTDTSGIANYLLQISTLSDFSVLTASYTLASNVYESQVSQLGDSPYYWQVRALDNAGNYSAAQSTVEQFRVDTTGPSTGVSSNTNLTRNSIRINALAANDGSGVGASLSAYKYAFFKSDADCSTNSSTSSLATATFQDYSSLSPNTQYCFKVQAQDSLQNTGSNSAATKYYTLANQVSSMSVSAAYQSGLGNYLNIGFSANGASGLKIEEDAACDGSYETTVYDNASTVPSSPYQVTGKSANTCYQYRISSYNGDAVLNTVDSATISSDTTPPAIVSALSHTSNTESTVSFDWEDISGANSYQLYNSSDVFLGNVTSSTYQQTGMAANTQFCIKVAALSNVNGEGGKSSAVCGYSSANVPTSLTTSTQTDSSLTWSWASGGSQSAYNAYTLTPSASSGWITALSWLQSSLSQNQTFTGYVKARNADNDETAAISASASTRMSTPEVPSFSNVTTNQIQVSVTNLANLSAASSGVFFENTTNAANSTFIQSSSWTNSSLEPNSTYSYRVKARNSSGIETAWGTANSKTTLAAVPTLVAGESMTKNSQSLRINSNLNPDPTDYQIYRSNSNTGDPDSSPAEWTQVIDFTAKNNNDTLTVSSLSPGTSYYYKIRARNKDNVNTAWSASASATTPAEDPNLSEINSHLPNVWFNSGDLIFKNNVSSGISYYRYSFGSSASISDCSQATDTASQAISTFSLDGTPLDDQFTVTLPSSSGTYYLNILSCSSAGGAGTLAQLGPYLVDLLNPTITNNYASSGVLVAAPQTVTLNPQDTGGSGVNLVKYCVDSDNTCTPATVLSSPYQFSYTQSASQYVRYIVSDNASNSSATNSYHLLVDADSPSVGSLSVTVVGDTKSASDLIAKSGDNLLFSITESSSETGLTGYLQVTSASKSYDSGEINLIEDGGGAYHANLDTSSLAESADYVVEIRLKDSVNNTDTDGLLSGADATFTLDNTAPQITAFTISDASSASSTITNSQSVNISLTDSDNSAVFQYLINESATTPVLSDFSLTVKPTSFNLSSTDADKTVYAWLLDRANNISLSSNQTIKLDTTPAVAVSFIVKDASSSSVSYTNAAAITVDTFNFTDANGIAKYLVNESSTTPSVNDMNTNGADNAQTAYTINGGEGLRTIYGWVMDTAENISSASQQINLDLTAPTINQVKYFDLDSDGMIDRVSIRFSESIFNSGTSVTSGAGFTIAGMAISSSAGLTTDLKSNDTLLLNLTESSVETANMPDLTYSGGNIQDLAENLLASVATNDVTELDGVGPVYVSSEIEDVNSNGKADRVKVTMSETIAAITDDSANWSVSSVPSSGTLSTVTASGSDAFLYLNLQEGAGDIDTSANSMQFSFLSSGSLKDTANNQAGTFSNKTPADKMKPIFTATTNSSSGPATIKLNFSEKVSSTANSTAVWSVTSNTISSVTSLDGSTELAYLSLNSDFLDTSATPQISYTAGDIKDASNNLIASNTVTSTDGISPEISLIELKDINSDGYIETAEITFKEAVLDSSLSINGFSLDGAQADTFSTTVGADSDSNDEKISIKLSSGVEGTDIPSAEVSYVSAVGNLSDLNGNKLADRDNSALPNEVDKASPVILSASYSEGATAAITDDTILITFSESIKDSPRLSTVASDDFAVSGGGSLGNASLSTGSSADDNQVLISMGSSSVALTPGVSSIALTSAALEDAALNVTSSLTPVTLNGSLVINEIQWGGMNSNTSDQYLELRNMTSAVLDFSQVNHVLCQGSTSIATLTSGTVAANSFYLLSALDLATSKLNITPDLVGFSANLLNSGNLSLGLRTGTDCSGGQLIDSAWNNTAPNIGGDNIAMERKNTPGDGSSVSVWYQSDATANFDSDANTYKGTPKTANLLDGQSPTIKIISPDTREPAANSLVADPQPKIRVEYVDNDGGVGINSTTVKVYIFQDNNSNQVYDAGDTGWGDVSASGATSITTSRIEVTPSAPLPAGKNTVRVEVSDYSGNTATHSWNFWVDSFSFQVTELDEADLELIASIPSETNTQTTKLEVKTYGAAIDISAYAPQLNFSGNTIENWDNTKGFAWRLSSSEKAVSNTSGNCSASSSGVSAYASLSNNSASTTSIANISKVSDMTQDNCLKTYSYYLQYKANVDATKQAGIYNSNLQFVININY